MNHQAPVPSAGEPQLSNHNQLMDMEQFSQTTQSISEAMRRGGPYFKETYVVGYDNGLALGNGRTKGEQVLAELEDITEEAQWGHLTEPKSVQLFLGSQSRNVQYERERDNNGAVESLFLRLAEQAGIGTYRGYYDIENIAIALDRDGVSVRQPAGISEAVQVTDRAVAALKDDKGALTGVQLKVGKNLFANFSLGNFNKPDHPGGGTMVDLFVVPQPEEYMAKIDAHEHIQAKVARTMGESALDGMVSREVDDDIEPDSFEVINQRGREAIISPDEPVDLAPGEYLASAEEVKEMFGVGFSADLKAIVTANPEGEEAEKFYIFDRSINARERETLGTDLSPTGQYRTNLVIEKGERYIVMTEKALRQVRDSAKTGDSLKHRTGWAAFKANTRITMGRNEAVMERFVTEFNRTVSRRHFELQLGGFDGWINVRDLHSSNKTSLRRK